MKKPSLKTLRNKADKLLTPIIIKLFPRCLLCNAQTQVAHHFIKKSESNRLRYVIDNLIPLCHKCHCALHSHETIYSGKITLIKGTDWLLSLLKLKQEYQKVDRLYYETNIERLKNYE